MIGEKGIEELLSQMTIAEKVNLCHGVTKFRAGGVPRLGVEGIVFSDGPHGVRQEIQDDSWEPVDCDWDASTCLPVGTALAATWSTKCAEKFGRTLGEEARFRKKDMILGPGINLMRTPLCGRNFEYLGEDPVLAGAMATENVKAIQKCGTAACAKHFAANSQEWHRRGVDCCFDERTLREIYLAAFETVVKDGGVWSVMGAYNKIRGQYCNENDYLLNQILKKEWGFDGVVVSDWAAVENATDTQRNGLDVEMGTVKPYNEYLLADPFQKAIEDGNIDMAVLDDKARRVLRLLDRVGKLDHTGPVGSFNTPEHQTVAREIAEESLVLLKNENNLLPLNAEKLKNILVVGLNAEQKQAAGGGSSGIKAFYEITPLDVLQKKLGSKVTYFRGYPDAEIVGNSFPATELEPADIGAGAGNWVWDEYDNENLQGDYSQRNFLADAVCNLKTRVGFSAKLHAVYKPQSDVSGTIILYDARHCRLLINGEVVIDRVPNKISLRKNYTFQAGKRYELCIEILPNVGLGNFQVALKFTTEKEKAEAEKARKELFSLAKKADVILYFGGINHSFDCEGADKPDMKLPYAQDELISNLAACNPNLVVTMLIGSPVEMPWVDKVKTLVWSSYLGMEAGNAVYNVFFGAKNFSGHLPYTLPKKLQDSPAHALNDYHYDRSDCPEGIFIGYRWFEKKQIAPLFPFGFGISYTTFKIDDFEVEKTGDFTCRVSATVSNTGKCSGKAVLQLYVADTVASVRRPVKELKRFAKTQELAPNATEWITWELDFRDFAFFHPVDREWTAEPGEFKLQLGFSSAEIVAEKVVTF